ncbi:MAG: hypothetical protein RLZZ238_651, partial [Planctomycetota bacterium]
RPPETPRNASPPRMAAGSGTRAVYAVHAVSRLRTCGGSYRRFRSGRSGARGIWGIALRSTLHRATSEVDRRSGSSGTRSSGSSAHLRRARRRPQAERTRAERTRAEWTGAERTRAERMRANEARRCRGHHGYRGDRSVPGGLARRGIHAVLRPPRRGRLSVQPRRACASATRAFTSARSASVEVEIADRADSSVTEGRLIRTFS